MTKPPHVRTGQEVLCEQHFAPLRGLRVGLVTHPAAVDRQLRHAADLFAAAADVRLVALFGPEHGLLGTAQDLIPIPDGQDSHSGLRVHSLYGETFDRLRPTVEQLSGLDALVIDLQDVGSRYYTFQATMLFCLEAAAKQKLLTVVLDRPNPLGGVAVEGPTIQPGYESFVGIHPMAIRHGLTIGELAQLYKAERLIDGELLVVRCEGWRREMDFEATGLPWVLPSPNMPTVETAFVYPGTCLLEGTNLSEGRGTTRPFELCGAPWIGPRQLCHRLFGEVMSLFATLGPERGRVPVPPAATAVSFRPTWFQPTFHKFAGKVCGGLQLHVRDRAAFAPVRTGLAVLAALRERSADCFAWRTEPYEFVADRLAIDLLFGSDRERLALEEGRPLREIVAAWEPEEEAFRERRKPHLLYD